LARELLIDAGYSEGFTITLKTPVDVYYQDVIVAEAIAQQLGEIGITVDVEAIGYWPTYVQKLLSDDTNYLFLLGLNSHGDVLEDVKIFSNTFAFNPTGWENDNFENILTRAANTFNEIPRIRLLNEAQAIVYDEAPWIWLWRPYRFYGINHNLDWWTPRSDGLIHLYRPITVTTEISE
jgi:peptide/nickel transport system substrate-binding protein